MLRSSGTNEAFQSIEKCEFWCHITVVWKSKFKNVWIAVFELKKIIIIVFFERSVLEFVQKVDTGWNYFDGDLKYLVS